VVQPGNEPTGQETPLVLCVYEKPDSRQMCRRKNNVLGCNNKGIRPDKKKLFDGKGECIKCWAAQAAGECIMQIFAY
jgi:hypothetical protein